MNKTEINNLLYAEKNYSKIKELLQNSDKSWSFNVLAKISLNEGKIKQALELFKKAGNTECMGYCYFLMGELQKAIPVLLLTKESSPFTKWLLFLISFSKGKTDTHPTFFQIRNFYEQDLEMLLNTKQYEIVQKILDNNPYFAKFNSEVYKYSARVLFNRGFNEEAKMFLNKSLDVCYKDPETHYILGEIYTKEGNKIKALSEFKKAIAISGIYKPAQKRIKDLQS
ncbi:MAG: tetratricopeptide repeat protein [Candidatus Avigastranaerophilus sp.]